MGVSKKWGLPLNRRYFTGIFRFLTHQLLGLHRGAARGEGHGGSRAGGGRRAAMLGGQGGVQPASSGAGWAAVWLQWPKEL